MCLLSGERWGTPGIYASRCGEAFLRATWIHSSATMQVRSLHMSLLSTTTDAEFYSVTGIVRDVSTSGVDYAGRATFARVRNQGEFSDVGSEQFPPGNMCIRMQYDMI